MKLRLLNLEFTKKSITLKSINSVRMKIGVVIVDDDNKNLDYLRPFVSSMDYVSFLMESYSVEQAIKQINDNKPNLVFLDVELPDGLGFDVLEKCDFKDFSVIFITAHEKYALRAIKFSAIDYLLKPYGYDDVFGAMERYKSLVQPNSKILLDNLLEKNIQEKRIGINSLNGINYIKLGEIVRCEAQGNYTFFNLQSGVQELSSKPIKEYEELLEEFSFVRVHKSHLINLYHVKSYLKSEGGSVLLNDGSEVPISKNKKDEFLKKMKLFYV